MKTKPSKKSFYVVLIAAIIMIILTFFLYFSSYSLNDLSSFTAIFSFIFAYLFYFGNRYKKESDEIKKECGERKHILQILYNEMRYVLGFFDADKNLHIHTIEMKDLVIRGVKISDQSITYLDNSIRSDMYDSLKFSGKISLINYNFHHDIQNIFLILKLHDETLNKIYDIQDNMDLLTIDITKDNTFKMKTYNYFKALQDYEKKLKVNIPHIMKYLEKELNIKC